MLASIFIHDEKKFKAEVGDTGWANVSSILSWCNVNHSKERK